MSDIKATGSFNPVDAYLGLLGTHPLKTKIITAGVMSSISDVFAQKLLGNKEVNLASTQKQATLGMIFRAPFMHYWYKVLEKAFAGYDPKSPLTVAMKVACEQLLAAPILCCLNVVLTGLFDGKSADEIKETLRNTFFTMWKNNIKVWAIVGAVQYRFVPERLRVFVGNIVGMFWNAYVILLSKGGAKPASVAPKALK